MTTVDTWALAVDSVRDMRHCDRAGKVSGTRTVRISPKHKDRKLPAESRSIILEENYEDRSRTELSDLLRDPGPVHLCTLASDQGKRGPSRLSVLFRFSSSCPRVQTERFDGRLPLCGSEGSSQSRNNQLMAAAAAVRCSFLRLVSKVVSFFAAPSSVLVRYVEAYCLSSESPGSPLISCLLYPWYLAYHMHRALTDA